MLWDYKTKHFLCHTASVRCSIPVMFTPIPLTPEPWCQQPPTARPPLWSDYGKKEERRMKQQKNRDSNHPSKPGKLPDPWPLSPLWNVSNSVSMLVILQTSSSRRVHWYALVSDGNKNYYACPVMTTNPLTMYLNAFHVYLQENLFALSISPFSLNDRPLREEVIYD